MLDILNIEITAMITATWVAAVVCLVLLTKHQWWTSLHGQTLGWLTIATIGIFTQRVLGYWHLVNYNNTISNFVCHQFFFILPFCFMTMVWQLVRPHLQRGLHDNPEEELPSQERQSTR